MKKTRPKKRRALHPLGEFRAKLGLSKTQAAILLGVSENMIVQIEHGHRNLAAAKALAADKVIPKSVTRPDLFQ